MANQTEDAKLAAEAKRAAQITDINNRFSYHPPKGDQAQRYENLRDQAKSLALSIVALTPASREQALALTKLEEAVMHANSAIARNE